MLVSYNAINYPNIVE
jgi:hypothetical protein